MDDFGTEESWEHILSTRWERFLHLVQTARERLQIDEKLERAQRFAQEHPIYTLGAAVSVLVATVPILIFMMFVLWTTIFACLGFLLFEGTLLTVGTVVLSAVLLFVGFISLGLTALVTLVLYASKHGTKLWRQIKQQITSESTESNERLVPEDIPTQQSTKQD